MDQQGNGTPDKGTEGRASLPEGQENRGEQDERQTNASVSSLPMYSLEQQVALHQQAARMSPGFHPAGSYNQQIVESAAAQAVAALAAISDHSSQQQQQLPQCGSRGSGHQDASVASLVSTLSAQQPGANLLSSAAFSAQFNGLLPMMLAQLQQSSHGHPLSQTPAWFNPAMNPAASVPYAAAGGANVAQMYRPAASESQEAQPNSAVGSPSPSGSAGLPQAGVQPSTQATGGVASVERSQRPTVPLFLDYDREVLTEYQCLLRQQIELFEAGPEDIRENVKGRIKPVRVDQLGIRCRHCKMLPPEHRARGAVYFAYNVEGIYQLAQNMGKKHLCDGCGEIPTGLKHKLSQMYRSKENNNRRAGGKAYWVESLAVLGVYKDKATGMLRLEPSIQRR
jgi:hypothetical protein